jgi:hypothetical protein
MNMARKNAAVAAGGKSGKKGRQARSRKIAAREEVPQLNPDTSDQALAALLNRLKAAVDLAEIRQLSGQIERVVFHKQFTNA